MTDHQQSQIFLSHAGEDHKEAKKLAKRLEKALRTKGHNNIEVFNTSETEHRFKDLHEILKSGDLFRQKAYEWSRELRKYLKKNILYSKAYLLLVTRNSAQKKSEWIKFEIEVAKKVSGKRDFFFPCIIGGADFSDLPRDVRYFQAVDLRRGDGFEELVYALAQAFANGVDNRNI